MRFRGKIIDIDCIHHFTNIANTIHKLLRTCCLRITKENLYFILPAEVSNGGVSMWCELIQGSFFDQYQMEGIRPENNEIYLEINAENFYRAVKSAHNAKSLKIKLIKKQSPFLSFEIDLPSFHSNSRSIVHDVPVRVIPLRMWLDYQEPEIPEFHVSLCVPPLKKLKTIAEQLKNMSSYVMISCNQDGNMDLKVESPLVTVVTHFHDLEVPNYEDMSLAPSKSWSRDEYASVRIDIKRLIQFLSGQQICPYKVMCNIIHETAVHFFLIHDDVKLQFYLPSMNI